MVVGSNMSEEDDSFTFCNQFMYWDDASWHNQTYQMYDGLSDNQLSVVDNIACRDGKLCMLKFYNTPYPEGLHCNASWDSYNCWDTTPANTTVSMPCPDFTNMRISPRFSQVPRAYRTCNASGMWNKDGWVNYTVCALYYYIMNKDQGDVEQTLLQDEAHKSLLAKVVVNIYFFGGLLSLILLVLTLFIFTYFRTLQCSRLSIHKNLVASFILRSLVTIITFRPFVVPSTYSYRDVDWLCKLLVCILLYSYVANIFWMFVEGLFLHNRIAVTVFHTDAPFKVFHFVGWALPGLILTTWALCMHFYNPHKCWIPYYDQHSTWLIIAPCMLALIVSAIFLVNIIRILITRLRANNTLETDQVRKAVKATAVLFPLLGTSNMIFFVRPPGNIASETAYRVINAFLQSSQGIFVSVIYCFMNAEVRLAIRKKWLRYQNMRMGRSHIRHQSCRTSSSFLSTSEGTNLGLNPKNNTSVSASTSSQRQKSKMRPRPLSCERPRPPSNRTRNDGVNPESPSDTTSTYSTGDRGVTSFTVL